MKSKHGNLMTANSVAQQVYDAPPITESHRPTSACQTGGGAVTYEGSRPQRHCRRFPPPPAPIAQLDRALASEARGYRFESCWGYLAGERRVGSPNKTEELGFAAIQSVRISQVCRKSQRASLSRGAPSCGVLGNCFSRPPARARTGAVGSTLAVVSPAYFRDVSSFSRQEIRSRNYSTTCSTAHERRYRSQGG